MDFSQTLLNWYHQHKRDLPWRSTNDPYIIWLSEIILQQTRVDQGLPYFSKFAETYPTVQHFAEAAEDEILKNWQGLGYYSRGRNMHKTAQMVMEDYGGYFPKKYDELIKLKGIGEYTAAAISSFAADEAKAVVDGNVFRLLARCFGIDEPINSVRGKKIFTEIADSLLDKSNPGLFNQAIMEFGSLQCKPKNPLCESCPFQSSCVAFKGKRINQLPVKIKKQALKNRYFNFLVFCDENQILMQKRTGSDIWQNLYQLPLVETPSQISAHDLLTTSEFFKDLGDVKINSVVGPVKQLLSHQKIHAQFIQLETERFQLLTDCFWTDYEAVLELAQPKIIFDFLKKFLT